MPVCVDGKIFEAVRLASKKRLHQRTVERNVERLALPKSTELRRIAWDAMLRRRYHGIRCDVSTEGARGHAPKSWHEEAWPRLAQVKMVVVDVQRCQTRMWNLHCDASFFREWYVTVIRESCVA